MSRIAVLLITVRKEPDYVSYTIQEFDRRSDKWATIATVYAILAQQ